MTHIVSSKLQNSVKTLSGAILATLILGACSATEAKPPIVKPGGIGPAPIELSKEEAVKIADSSYSQDDVKFMQDMIPHHHQATQLAGLVAERTNNKELTEIADLINASQADEIKFMQDWLNDRGEQMPDPAAHDHMHMSHAMAGMATPEQMAKLATLESVEFDKMFLQLMIKHHEGALTMVEKLLDQPGSAYDTVLFQFTNDIVKDQTAEIERMNKMLVGLSVDPRAGLKPGFADAGQAIKNLELVVSLPKPDGFFDPENPAELPMAMPVKEGEEPKEEDDKQYGERNPLLSFSNTDMAFAGDKLVAGSYHGFNVYQLDDNGVPSLYSSIVCPGGQGDVSIVGDLLIMSVEESRGRVDCGLEGVEGDVSKDRFRGIRIFDISDYASPVQVGQVQTCRGSHTHSVVSGPGEDGKIVVYNSGTAGVRENDELPGCFDESPGDERTALFRIDVIEIPVADPSKSRIVSSPAVFADEETGRLAGLWRGGDHGDDTQETRMTNQCHDITVFPELKIAGGACSGNGILFDISDPYNPTRIDEVVDEGFAYWHSATFNNDGTKVLYTDEWGGGSRPRCRSHDKPTWGANAIYDIVDGELQYRSHFKIPAPQVDEENCVAHNGSIIPVPGRDIFVQAWYQGGISVIDFTDSANPVEIAFFDRGPISDEHLITGGFWSAYWYNGKIYGTEIVRGLDVLALTPSDYLSANEIAAAGLADQGQLFNPQQQFRVTWPAEPVIAKAYIDQLQRSETLSAEMVTEMTAALDKSDAALKAGKSDKATSDALKAFAKSVSDVDDSASAKRRAQLSNTMTEIADRLGD
ncbi:MAG: DUF305 domain-containing protein [Gammaproteobacteria bacterium]